MCCPKGKCGCQYFILLTLKKKKIMDTGVLDFFLITTSVDTEMCCPKGKCGRQYFILLTLEEKQIHRNRGPGFF